MLIFNQVNNSDLTIHSGFDVFFKPMQSLPFFGDWYNLIICFLISVIGILSLFKSLRKVVKMITYNKVDMGTDDIVLEKIQQGEKWVINEWERRKKLQIIQKLSVRDNNKQKDEQGNELPKQVGFFDKIKNIFSSNSKNKQNKNKIDEQEMIPASTLPKQPSKLAQIINRKQGEGVKQNKVEDNDLMLQINNQQSFESEISLEDMVNGNLNKQFSNQNTDSLEYSNPTFLNTDSQNLNNTKKYDLEQGNQVTNEDEESSSQIRQKKKAVVISSFEKSNNTYSNEAKSSIKENGSKQKSAFDNQNKVNQNIGQEIEEVQYYEEDTRKRQKQKQDKQQLNETLTQNEAKDKNEENLNRYSGQSNNTPNSQQNSQISQDNNSNNHINNYQDQEIERQKSNSNQQSNINDNNEEEQNNAIVNRLSNVSNVSQKGMKLNLNGVQANIDDENNYEVMNQLGDKEYQKERKIKKKLKQIQKRMIEQGQEIPDNYNDFDSSDTEDENEQPKNDKEDKIEYFANQKENQKEEDQNKNNKQNIDSENSDDLEEYMSRQRSTVNKPVLENRPSLKDSDGGWVYKKSENKMMRKLKGWTKKYLVVKEDRLAYYEGENLQKKGSEIPMKSIVNVVQYNKDPRKAKKEAEEDKDLRFIIFTKDRQYDFKTENEQDAVEWVDHIQNNVQRYLKNKKKN